MGEENYKNKIKTNRAVGSAGQVCAACTFPVLGRREVVVLDGFPACCSTAVVQLLACLKQWKRARRPGSWVSLQMFAAWLLLAPGPPQLQLKLPGQSKIWSRRLGPSSPPLVSRHPLPSPSPQSSPTPALTTSRSQGKASCISHLFWLKSRMHPPIQPPTVSPTGRPRQSLPPRSGKQRQSGLPRLHSSALALQPRNHSITSRSPTHFPVPAAVISGTAAAYNLGNAVHRASPESSLAPRWLPPTLPRPARNSKPPPCPRRPRPRKGPRARSTRTTSRRNSTVWTRCICRQVCPGNLAIWQSTRCPPSPLLPPGGPVIFFLTF